MRPGLRPHSPAIPLANASGNNVSSIGPWIAVHTLFHAYNQTVHSEIIPSVRIALEPRDNTGMGTWRMLRPPLAVGVLFAGQLARAILRDDLPTLENQDPSGIFGSPDDPPLTIVFLGDSSVTAPGVEPLDHSWPRQIAFHLATSYRVTALSTAVGGAKVKDVLDLQLDVALEAKPDLAYVSVGSNDALRGSSTARFEADYDRVVGRLHSRVPAVGLSGIGDLGTIPRLPELARGVARIRARSIDAAIARTSRAPKPNVIEASYRRFLQLMDRHLAAKPYLMGERPGASDFATYGQLTCLVGFDPTPAAIALEESFRTCAWTEKLEDLSGLDPLESDWITRDAIPPTIMDLLREVGRVYAPYLVANAAAVEAGDAELSTTIDGKPWVQKPFPYQRKCNVALREARAALSDADRAALDAILSGTGCEVLFEDA